MNLQEYIVAGISHCVTIRDRGPQPQYRVFPLLKISHSGNVRLLLLRKT